jgi:hypothetical protein
MANIRKSFNFRNGLQVDQSNLLVDPLGKVGIGTSVPNEILHVVGNVTVSGFVTSKTLYANNFSVSGVTTLTAGSIGLLSIPNSGIVTAITGILTYYGDGSELKNLPTSQWINVNVGGGFTSIYAQGYVGVSTNNPTYAFQVGGTSNLNNFVNGVGINSLGSIYATGIVTASNFRGTFTGNGSNINQLNASNISSGSIGNSYLPNNISVSGIITASSFYGNLIGVANTANFISTTANVIVNSINSSYSNIGVTTTTNLKVNGNVGINTNITLADLHITNSNSSSIKLNSPNTSSFTFGSGTSNTNIGELRFVNTNGSLNYGKQNTVEIINYEYGNVNSYIHLGPSVGLNTGSFNWFYGKTPNIPLASLTYTGKLGIGITNPTETLSVVGTSTITSTAYFGSTVRVKGQVVADSSVTASSFVGNGIIPIGGIIMWSGSISSIPSGWSLCDGTGGTPDLRDRFIVGVGSAYNPGDIGGSSTVTLDITQIPPHTHTYTFESAVVDANEGSFPANNNDVRLDTLNTGSTGGLNGVTQAHENRPPYYALAFIIRTS